MIKINNKIYLSWGDIDDLVTVLCEKITKGPNITHVTGLSRGGLIPAVLVSHRLGIPYTDKLLCGEDNKIDGEYTIQNTLVIDDICDSGHTLSNQEGVLTAVLHHKPDTSTFTPTIHATIHEGDEWIIYPWENKNSKAIQDYKI